MFNRHAGNHNHSSDKPLIGVIALQNELTDFGNESVAAIADKSSLVDFVWTLDGDALLPAFRSGENLLYYTHTARPCTRTWADLSASDFASAESPFYHLFAGDPLWGVLRPDVDPSGRARVFSIVLGVVSLMLSRICARPLREDQVNGYYIRPAE